MKNPIESMSAAEAAVLELMRNGLTNREIASRLSRSEFTIKTHVQRILAKTGARNRAHACVIAASSPQEQ